MTIQTYFKKIILLILLLSIFTACSTASPEREEIVKWASQIARIEKQLEYEITYFQPLINRVTSNPPTNEDLSQLTEYNNRITSLYNEISNLSVPQKAKTVHALYVENYAKVSDTARYYVLAIKMNDLSYFDKSVSAAQEANKLGDEAYSAFANLLDDYSISCSEIDFCE